MGKPIDVEAVQAWPRIYRLCSRVKRTAGFSAAETAALERLAHDLEGAAADIWDKLALYEKKD